VPGGGKEDESITGGDTDQKCVWALKFPGMRLYEIISLCAIFGIFTGVLNAGKIHPALALGDRYVAIFPCLHTVDTLFDTVGTAAAFLDKVHKTHRRKHAAQIVAHKDAAHGTGGDYTVASGTVASHELDWYHLSFTRVL